MSNNDIGACIDIYREGLLEEPFKKVLQQYAKILNECCGSFTIRFMEPLIRSEYELEQVIKATGYRPTEAIVLCGFYDPIFYAAEEIMRMFGGYLRAGAPEDVIPKIKGKSYKICYQDEYDPPGEFRSYRLLDADFVGNYFNVKRNPNQQDIFSLGYYDIDGVMLKGAHNRRVSN